MCGISGIFHRRDAAPADRGLLERMNAIQHHRGPDEEGYYVDGPLGFGHVRLSIIDLSSGQQPMRSPDGEYVICYNGEVYNFQELREELRALGHQFRTRCDTEVILHAYMEWGASVPAKLRGMFAFAIWDKPRRRLFLARDRLGIKPLYYAELADGAFLFGSELKSVLMHRGVARDIDPQAVEDYLALGYVPEPKTILAAVRKLPPAHCMTIAAGEGPASSEAYWDVRFDRPSSHSAEALQGELIERLREAIRIRMIADVPLGAFLSGGVDSSAVVALMAGLSDAPVNSCAIGFDTDAYDETRHAARVAERYATNHFVKTVASDDYDLIDKLAFHYDEPFADGSAIPTYRVSQLARQRVTVALSGDGGDEIFAGYRRHRMHMLEQTMRDRLPYGLRRTLFGALGRLYPKLDWAPRFLRAKTTFQGMAMDEAEAYYHTMCFIRDQDRLPLYSGGFKARLGGYHASGVICDAMARAPADDPLSRIQYTDMKTNMVGGILTKVDRASMAHGLEVRVPMLDHHFVEWAATVPAALRLQGGEGKAILKKALRPFLDDETLYRDKMGFVTPIADWFRGPLKARIEHTLTGARLLDLGYFEAPALKAMLDQHLSGRRDHGRALWSLVMFDASLAHLNEL